MDVSIPYSTIKITHTDITVAQMAVFQFLIVRLKYVFANGKLGELLSFNSL